MIAGNIAMEEKDMQEDNELIELKAIYDDLWADAKTFAKDMTKSVYIYRYAALLTFAVAIITVFSAIPYYATMLLGHGNLVTDSVITVNVIAVAVEIVFGSVLWRWYSRIKRRYAKLIEMQKTWRKTDA
jgi:hypothetical protein